MLLASLLLVSVLTPFEVTIVLDGSALLVRVFEDVGLAPELRLMLADEVV